MGNRTVSAFPPRLSTIGLWPSVATDLRAGLLVALAYYAGSLIGFSLRFPSSGIAYIWPPNAILLTSLLVLRPRVWPTAIVAAFAAHGTSHGFNGVPPIMWVWQFAGNAFQAVLAATIVSRLSDQPLRYATLRSVTVFFLGAAVAAPAIASLLPAYAYVRLGWASDFWTAWEMRTLTNLVTTVTLVPPLVTIFGENRRIFERLRVSRVAEFIALLLGLLAAHNAAFVLPHTPLSGLPMSLVASMPFLAWAAARFSTPGLSVFLLAVGLLAIGDPGVAKLPGVSAAQMIMGVQLFVGITASPFMFLSAALEESEHTRRAEAALHRSEAKNAAILRALPDLVFVLTKDEHRYVDFYCSNETELMVPPDQFIGQRMRDVFSAEFSRAFEEVFAQVVDSGGPRMLEYSLPIQGEQRFYEARVVACDDDRLLSIIRDITERKRAEAALHDAQHALGRMSRASDLGELSASIAHEVRQPLSAIGANAAACLRWIEQDAADSRQLEVALADIVRDVGRAGDVIKRTRELFGSGTRENAPVEVNATIREVLALTRHRVERRGESIRTDLTQAPLWVMGDRVQLQQVLFNLVMNGLQAMGGAVGAPGPLLVRSWRADGFVHVAVRDRGPGFAPSDADRLFDPFYTTKPDGLGIGLSISRSIIRAHGGTLKASLNGDGGATFEFRVPATPPQGALATARPVDAA